MNLFTNGCVKDTWTSLFYFFMWWSSCLLYCLHISIWTTCRLILSWLLNSSLDTCNAVSDGKWHRYLSYNMSHVSLLIGHFLIIASLYWLLMIASVLGISCGFARVAKHFIPAELVECWKNCDTESTGKDQFIIIHQASICNISWRLCSQMFL